MKKRPSGSSAPGARARRSGVATSARHIDFSDLPELSDDQLKGMHRIGRPLLGLAKRQLISIRIDASVLDAIKSRAKRQGKGYQTLINEILSHYAA